MESVADWNPDFVFLIEGQSFTWSIFHPDLWVQAYKGQALIADPHWLEKWDHWFERHFSLIQSWPNGKRWWNNETAFYIFAQCKEQTEQALALLPYETSEWWERLAALIKSQRTDEALAFLDSLITFQPNDPDLWAAKARAAGEVGRFEESLNAFNRLIVLQPDSARNYAGRGLCLEGLQRYEEALTDFDKSTELAPTAADNFDGRGVVLSRLHRFDDALKSYDKALELDPKLARAVYNRACAYSLQGEKSKALAELRKAIAMDVSFKDMAPKDEDFKNVWQDAEFRKLTRRE